ncbi:MAG: damage-inducible protein DinB, partial [Chitinophaga sp.]|nr:damage-inducible protein DinB [Chitinophaga sp.]
NEGITSNQRITANAIAYILFGHLMHHKNIIEERYL